MKKYGIVSFCNIYVLPYAKTYIDAIRNKGAECTLIFWDRDTSDGVHDNYRGCIIKSFQKLCTNESPAIDKIRGYIEGVRFFNRVLMESNYDGVVFLQTHAAVACMQTLLKKYRNRYIVDIRDWTLEHIPIYKFIERKCIIKSFCTVLSSPAYKSFLPDYSYTIAHNFTPFFSDNIEKWRSSLDFKNKKEIISISFVGTIRFVDMDKKILSLFANDSRFKINYFGIGSEILKKYCQDNEIMNVEFYGSFSPEMTESFYNETDLINNLYGNHNNYLDYALSNKLYHAIQFYKPILVCPHTYMEKIILEYGLGFVFDVDNKTEPDRLFEWYHSFDADGFVSGCKKFLETVIKDNKNYHVKIGEFLDY